MADSKQQRNETFHSIFIHSLPVFSAMRFAIIFCYFSYFFRIGIKTKIDGWYVNWQRAPFFFSSTPYRTSRIVRASGRIEPVNDSSRPTDGFPSFIQNRGPLNTNNFQFLTVVHLGHLILDSFITDLFRKIKKMRAIQKQLIFMQWSDGYKSAWPHSVGIKRFGWPHSQLTKECCHIV